MDVDLVHRIHIVTGCITFKNNYNQIKSTKNVENIIENVFE